MKTKAPLFEKQKILIHVGLHKCGSTWLQKNMFDNREIGFISPWGSMSSVAVTEFVAIDPLLFNAHDTRTRLDASSAVQPDNEHQTLVMSHEALSSRPHHGAFYAPLVASRLRDVFPHAKVLLIFREQSSLIHSLYGEHLRNGGRLSLLEFIGTGSEPPGFTSLCQPSFFLFDRLLNMYHNVFGAENVLALPLEMLPRNPDEFVRRICDFGGVKFKPLPTEKKVNTAWGPITYEILRWSNSIVRGNQLRPKTGSIFTARRMLLEGFDRATPQRLQLKAKRRQRELINNRIDGFYYESNARLVDMVNIDLLEYGYAFSKNR